MTVMGDEKRSSRFIFLEKRLGVEGKEI